jgi:translocation and assembly module TamB
MKRWLKYTGIGVGSVVLVLGLLLALTQTSFFRSWLKDLVVSRVNRHLNGQLSIKNIDGNLFTSVQVTDILVTTLHDTVLFVPRLKIDLSPSRLLHMELKVDSITIESPYAKLIQAPDSTWNIARLVRTDSLTQPTVTKKGGKSHFRIVLDDFILRGGSVALVVLDTTLPKAVTQIGMRFTAQYGDSAQQLELKGLSFSLDKPQFRLEQLSLNATRSGNKITLGNLVLKTARNQVGGQGTYVAADSAVSSGHLKSRPFDFSELRVFMPALYLSGNPSFEIETQLERDSLTVKLGVLESPQRIDLGLHVANVSKALNVTTHNQVRYYLDVALTNFSLAHWLGDTTLDYQANGTVKLSGIGLTAKDADISVTTDLSDLRALGRPVGRLTGTAHYAAGNLDGQFDALGEFGDLKSTFSVADVFESQKFSTDLEASHLDLAPLMHNDSLRSDLNFRALVQGTSLDKEHLTGNAQVNLSASTVANMRIDTAVVRGTFSAKEYRMDTLYAASEFGSINAAGQGTVGGINNLTFRLQLLSLTPARQLLKADSLAGDGTLSGTASGTLDSLLIIGDLELHKLQYNTFGIETVSGHISALSHNDILKGTAQLSAHRAGTSAFRMDSVAISTDFNAKNADVKIDGFYQKGIFAHIEGQITLDSVLSVMIPAIDLGFNERHWRGGSLDSRVTSRGDEYRAENLTLSSPLDSSGGVQTLSLAGLYRMTGDEDVTLKVDRFDLATVTSTFGVPADIGGRLSLDAHLGGTATSPTLSARISIDSGLVNRFSYRALCATINYENEKLTWSSSLFPYQGDSLSVIGFVPLNLSLTKAGDLLFRDRPLNVKVKTTGFPLSIIQASGEPFKQVDGFITADMSITNTINSPEVSGSFGLRNGKVSLPKYGIEYSDLLMNLSVHDATLTLDTLQAKRDQGSLTGSGVLQFEGSLLSGTIKTTQCDFLANSFYVIHHKDYQVQVSGDAHLTGNGLEPKFAGNITVIRSSVFLPAIMEEAAQAQAAANKSMPLLVKAALTPEGLADTVGSPIVRKSPPVDTTESAWYTNLRGQFKVKIPRNTWLRSPDMNLEIGEGDIDLVKNGPDFEIFGPLKILRGQYNLYGKHFTILQGSLLFQGGPEYNPEVSMQAQYIFRSIDREKRTLKLDVSGKAFKPVVQFTLDDNALEERDAIAYIMYGRSMDELTSGQKSDAGVAQADLAKGAAANLLSNQLSETLGSKLGLDVIDINSQGSLAAATMTVGKYLTNDLFMSYRRSIGQTPGQNAEMGNVTLEYELNKYLFLQLLQGDESTSGFDFIFKFQH